ncbi:hypothetical protein HOY82DRAFT_537099 [Tuber indicum]|nr:hypothetical protein HOY82DRAFT_537099 [Tuber indicum]
MEMLEKILLNQDRLDKKFDKQQQDIELLQRFLIPTLELQRELSIEKPFIFPTRKTFVESPNLLSRDIEIFNTLKTLQGQIQSIESGIHKSAEKITKDEGEMFCRRGLKMMTASTITLKKASVIHCLSEAISEEKSKFKSRLPDTGFRQLPIKDFAQHLFTRSTFIGCDNEKIIELQAVAAKWRKIKNLYLASSTQFRSQNNSDLDFQPIGENELLDTFPEGYENYSDNQRSETIDVELIDNGLDNILSDLN